MPDFVTKTEKVFHGIPVSPGICRGRVAVIGKMTANIPSRTISEEEIPVETRRLEQALVATRQQIQDVQRKVGAAIGAHDAGIFDAHLMVLEDPTLMDEVLRLADRVTVLRDGTHVSTRAIADTSRDEIIRSFSEILRSNGSLHDVSHTACTCESMHFDHVACAAGSFPHASMGWNPFILHVLP